MLLSLSVAQLKQSLSSVCSLFMDQRFVWSVVVVTFLGINLTLVNNDFPLQQWKKNENQISLQKYFVFIVAVESWPPEADGETEFQGSDVMPVSHRNEQHISRTQHAFQIRSLGKLRELLCVWILHLNLHGKRLKLDIQHIFASSTCTTSMNCQTHLTGIVKQLWLMRVQLVCVLWRI